MTLPADAATLENDTVRVTVLPGFGARVAALVDKRTGRDWMAPGGVSSNTGEDAVYSKDEAVGWDECFPTVSRCDAADTAWRRSLRDHGDLWGRPWEVLSQSATGLALGFSGTGFTFERTLQLDGAELAADYRVQNSGSEPLPFMWALHGLLATRPGEEIRLPGVNDVTASYVGLDGRALQFERLPWPGVSTALPFPLDRVQGVEARFAAKVYVTDIHAAAVGGPGGWLDLTWQGIDHLGIWITYGNWPAPGSPIHHVALEPTTAPIDSLRQGLDGTGAVTLAPGTAATWRVTMRLRPDDVAAG